MNKKYRVRVGSDDFEILMNDAEDPTVNGKPVKLDAVQVTEGIFSIIFEGAVYEVSLKQGETTSGQNGDSTGMTLLVNGRQHEVIVEDERSRLLKSVLGESRSSTSDVTVRAPMPGLITKIEVSEGETIKEGQGLVILEAMKMENEIKSSFRARVGLIHIRLKQSVDKGDALVTLSSI